MSDPNDIKVLVKKADGTFVHVSLAELEKQKKAEQIENDAKAALAAGSVVNKPSSLVDDDVPPANLPVGGEPVVIDMRTKKSLEENEMEEQNPKIETKIKFGLTKLDEPVQKSQDKPRVEVEKNDFSSLLEEELPVANKVVPLTSAGREKQIDAVMNALSFKIPSGNSSRLRTVIQLFLKDVRGEDATIEILRRPEIDGGLGFSENQAKEVIEKATRTALPVEFTPVIPLKDQKNVISKSEMPTSTENKIEVNKKEEIVGLGTSQNQRLEQELPIVKPTSEKTFAKQVQQNVVAAGSFTDKKTVSAPSAAKKILDDEVTKATLADVPVEPFRMKPEQIRPSMHDVEPNPVAIGPVDEIRHFNLVDFRRLSTDPVEASNRLKQKFLNLREESIMLYFEGWEAWKRSPLYHDYINTIADSIRLKVPMLKVNAADRAKIQMPEISALVRMEKQLG